MPHRPSIQTLQTLTPEGKWEATEPLAALDAWLDGGLEAPDRERRRELLRRTRCASRRRLYEKLNKVYGRTQGQSARQ